MINNTRRKKKRRLRKEVKTFLACTAGIFVFAVFSISANAVSNRTEKDVHRETALDRTVWDGKTPVITRLDSEVVKSNTVRQEYIPEIDIELLKKDAHENKVITTSEEIAKTTDSTQTIQVQYQPLLIQAGPEPVYVEPEDESGWTDTDEWIDPAYQEYIAYLESQQYTESVYEDSSYNGAVLTSQLGTIQGPSGKETFYNLPMGGVINIMRSIGNEDGYWVREDGVKMLGDYVMVAANLETHPRGSLVETSLGTGIVCDTGGFAYADPYQIDVATAW